MKVGFVYTEKIKFKKYQNFIKIELNYEEYNLIFIEDTGRKYENALKKHARDEGDGTTKSLCITYFSKRGTKLQTPLKILI